jgi:signal transduction histidine kinase
MFELFKIKKVTSKKSFQLSELIEILQDGVCITRDSGELIYLNKAAYFFLQMPTNSDISQINFFDAFLNDPFQKKDLKEQLENQGLVRNQELQLITQENKILDVILTANILGDYRRETFGYLFLFKDVTELKRIQHQLLQTQKLESVGLMASGIAHDFNNILAAIIPNAELIKISSTPGDSNFKRAEIIEKSAHRASEIAQRLLTFTRQSDHRNYETLNLNKVINESIELLEHGIPDKVELVRKLHSSLHYTCGDASQIQQVIMNLVLNAVDALPKGGMIEIRTENFLINSYYQVGSLDPGEYVRLTILDNGVGIPLEIISKIFDPFFTTKDIGKGTGLGLSVVYGIVKGMNGHIEVSSKLNEGTCFDIYLPIERKLNLEARCIEKEIHESKNMTILVIDDEDYVLNILADTLEYLGYDVVKFNSGKAALEYVKSLQNNLHYAIIDLKMPDMDGRDTSMALRKIKPDLKIIFTSGFDDHPISEDSMIGVVGFLKKPYTINQVKKSLKEILFNK